MEIKVKKILDLLKKISIILMEEDNGLEEALQKMKLKTVNVEDLETLPFDDIAYIILKEKGKKMKINEIFKIICDTLKLGDAAFENQIGDFFALLATEKRFIQLDKGYWDLRENHTAEISIKEIEDELDDEVLPEETVEEDEEEETNYNDEIDEVDDDKEEDDLKDLVIVDEGYEDDLDM